jgi:DNA-binding NtrC family response regulator
MRQIFYAFGHSAEEARNLTAAYGTLLKKRFDVVISQLHHDFARKVAVIMAIHSRSATPILLIGQRGMSDLPDEFSGWAEAIKAPFGVEDVFERIAAMMVRTREMAAALG